MTLTVFLADDEPIARRRLASLIASVPDLTLIGQAGDGVAAVESVSRQRPDILFLDIRMPELSGIEVVERLRPVTPAPAVIFTTAHDDYAVTAFELQAVDYLLKPFGRKRFLAAVERARQLVGQRGENAPWERIRAALTGGTAGGATVDRIFVRDRDAVLPLPWPEIVRLEAQDDYVMIHARGRQFLVSLRLQDLEARLPAPPFLRVHRSHLVNLDQVDRMVCRDDGRIDVQMKDGTTVAASRARSQEIRRQAR